MITLEYEGFSGIQVMPTTVLRTDRYYSFYINAISALALVLPATATVQDILETYIGRDVRYLRVTKTLLPPRKYVVTIIPKKALTGEQWSKRILNAIDVVLVGKAWLDRIEEGKEVPAIGGERVREELPKLPKEILDRIMNTITYALIGVGVVAGVYVLYKIRPEKKEIEYIER